MKKQFCIFILCLLPTVTLCMGCANDVSNEYVKARITALRLRGVPSGSVATVEDATLIRKLSEPFEVATDDKGTERSEWAPEGMIHFTRTDGSEKNVIFGTGPWSFADNPEIEYSLTSEFPRLASDVVKDAVK